MAASGSYSVTDPIRCRSTASGSTAGRSTAVGQRHFPFGAQSGIARYNSYFIPPALAFLLSLLVSPRASLQQQQQHTAAAGIGRATRSPAFPSASTSRSASTAAASLPAASLPAAAAASLAAGAAAPHTVHPLWHGPVIPCMCSISSTAQLSPPHCPTLLHVPREAGSGDSSVLGPPTRRALTWGANATPATQLPVSSFTPITQSSVIPSDVISTNTRLV